MADLNRHGRSDGGTFPGPGRTRVGFDGEHDAGDPADGGWERAGGWSGHGDGGGDKTKCVGGLERGDGADRTAAGWRGAGSGWWKEAGSWRVQNQNTAGAKRRRRAKSSPLRLNGNGASFSRSSHCSRISHRGHPGRVWRRVIFRRRKRHRRRCSQRRRWW